MNRMLLQLLEIADVLRDLGTLLVRTNVDKKYSNL